MSSRLSDWLLVQTRIEEKQISNTLSPHTQKPVVKCNCTLLLLARLRSCCVAGNSKAVLQRHNDEQLSAHHLSLSLFLSRKYLEDSRTFLL